MKPDLIVAGRSYTNASGRAERHVLEISEHVRVRWMGDDETEPKGEPGVRYVDTRLGNTFYGSRRGEMVLYLSAFASWAKHVVAAGEEAPHQ
jgi:hypothetical protein